MSDQLVAIQLGTFSSTVIQLLAYLQVLVAMQYLR